MTESNQPSSDQIASFLFLESSEAERENLEAAFFEDDDLFYSIVDLENDLTDEYAAKRMVQEKRVRFEKSLTQLPERIEKVANATALQNLIISESAKANPKPAEASWWHRMLDFITFHKMTVGLSFASLLMVAGLGLVAASFILLRTTGISPDIGMNSNKTANSNMMSRSSPTPLPIRRFVLYPNAAKSLMIISISKEE